MASLRKTRPGAITRIGGGVFSITRTCTGDVCVRSSTPRPSGGGGSRKNVSCMSRAGWSGGKLSALKLCQSSSISGPRATAKPNDWKMAWMSASVCVSTWRLPRSAGAGTRPGSVRSRSVAPASVSVARAAVAASRRS